MRRRWLTRFDAQKLAGRVVPEDPTRKVSTPFARSSIPLWGTQRKCHHTSITSADQLTADARA
jgi:hypothetical protein